MKKLSVIIAAYNMEALIAETLDSIVCQTMSDIEVVVANDCSSDKTADIVAEYAQKYPMIKLISLPQNSGPMMARKAACGQTKGKYIMFLDADDLLIPTACETAYNAIESQDTDILQFETEVFGEQDVLNTNKGAVAGVYSYMSRLENKIISSEKAGLLGRRECRDRINFTMWNKIYKKSLIDAVNKQLPDQHLAMAEDMLFSYITCFYAKSYASIPDKLHRYRFGTGISTSEDITEKRMILLSKTYFVYTYLKEWTQKQGCEKICQSRLEIMRLQFLKNLTGTLINLKSSTDRELFLSHVLEFCPLDAFLSALSFLVYSERAATTKTLAEIASKLPQLRATKKEVKTIATFYYRVQNGGIENVLSQITDIWIKNGYNVILFTDEKPSENDYPINPNVIRIALPAYMDKNFASFEERMSVISNSCRQYNVDVFIHHAWLHMYLLADVLAVKQLGIPFAIHTHSVFCADYIAYDIGYVHKNLMLPKLYALCDGIISLTRADCAFWSAFGLNCIQTINPITFKTDTPVADLKNHNVVMACRISPEKQILDAIKIIEKVRYNVPDATLTIVGTADNKTYFEQIEKYIQKHKLRDAVILPGFQKNVLPYYLDASAILITSQYEGFPLSLVESKMCGLPLVIYDLFHLDSVQEAKGMAVVAQNDISRAAEELTKILTDDALRHQMGKDARQSAENLYSVDFAALWDSIFDKILHPEPPKVLSPESYALLTMHRYTLQGVEFRAGPLPQQNESVVETQSDISALDAYTAHVLALEATVREIRSSTSYKLGWLLTWPLRKIKDKLKGQKYVE